MYTVSAESDETDVAALQKLGQALEGGAQTLRLISGHREIAGDRTEHDRYITRNYAQLAHPY